MLKQKEIDEILEKAKPSIIEGLRKEVVSAAIQNFKYSFESEIANHITKWIKEEILPEITKKLVEGKEGLISAGVKIVPSIVTAITESVTDSIKKKMEDSWDRKKILTALFE